MFEGGECTKVQLNINMLIKNHASTLSSTIPKGQGITFTTTVIFIEGIALNIFINWFITTSQHLDHFKPIQVKTHPV